MIPLFRPTYRVDECIESLREVLSSGWTGQGPKCKEFESQWCNFVKTKRSLFLNSATAGLHLAMEVSGIPKGSKIATTPFTFVSTNAVIVQAGYEPVFVDTFRDVPVIDPDKIPDVSGIMYVHWSGNVHESFEKILWNDLPLIEDCAHAAGAKYQDGLPVGCQGRKNNMSVFSFQAVKPLPTFDSGMFCTSDEDKYERARKLSWLGIDRSTFERTVAKENETYKWKYDVPELGWKYNGNDVAAAIGLVQLKYLEENTRYRQEIYRFYKENFDSNHFDGELIPHNSGSAVHFVAMRLARRDQVITKLKECGIAPGVHYLPNYKFKPFQRYYKPGQCPNAEALANELITLPTGLHMTREQVDLVCQTIRKAV